MTSRDDGPLYKTERKREKKKHYIINAEGHCTETELSIQDFFKLYFDAAVYSGSEKMRQSTGASKGSVGQRYYEELATRLLESNKGLRERLYSAACLAVEKTKAEEMPPSDILFTFLLTWATFTEAVPREGDSSVSNTEKDTSPVKLFTYVAPIAHLPKTVQVDVMEGSRTSPLVKDAQWFFDRELLSQRGDENCNEIVLMEPITNDRTKSSNMILTEGLSSNFFMVSRSGRVVTAEVQKVLPGTVRSAVIEACQQLAIPIQYRSPMAHELSSSEDCLGCFITSTSRGVKPIHRLIIHFEKSAEGNGVIDFGDYEAKGIVMRIAQTVEASLLRRSTRLS